MHVVHVVESISLASGGPARSSTQLAVGLQKCCDMKCTMLLQNNVQPSVDLCDSVGTYILSSGSPLRMKQRVTGSFEEVASEGQIDLVHIHGIWNPFLSCVASVSRSLRIPYVVATRGMLEPWSLKQKAFKKKLAWLAYQKRDLLKAHGVHVTAESERRSLRDLGLENEFVVPNGVDLPILKPVVRRKKVVLFLSRIHPKKGLDILLDAWAKLNAPGWILRIVGPGESAYRESLDSKIQELGIAETVEILDEVDDTQKWEHYQRASIFVLPTHSENFGIVVAEALAAEVPVITTTGTPWTELDSKGCGWCIELSEENLLTALTASLEMGDDDRMKMGVAGRRYVESNFSWEHVSKMMANKYREIVS